MSETIRSKSSAVKSQSDLPPPRDRKGIRPVSPPFSNTPLHRFNYYIALFAVVSISFYAWRLLSWKAEVGGWWNLALGKRPPGADAVVNTATGASPSGTPNAMGVTVEDRINELASALGMPSKDLTAAIANAVREHVPPASLSSVAAHESSGTAVQYLLNPTSAAVESETTAPAASGASRGVKAIASAFEAAVGLDEPPSEVGSV